MMRFLSKQLEEGEITWYLELRDNGKQVTTRMPVGGGATPEPPERKHGSNIYFYSSVLWAV
jgi:hypothetical protein